MGRHQPPQWCGKARSAMVRRPGRAMRSSCTTRRTNLAVALSPWMPSTVIVSSGSPPTMMRSAAAGTLTAIVKSSVTRSQVPSHPCPTWCTPATCPGVTVRYTCSNRLTCHHWLDLRVDAIESPTGRRGCRGARLVQSHVAAGTSRHANCERLVAQARANFALERRIDSPGHGCQY